VPQDSSRSRSRREDEIHGVPRLSPVSVRARAVIPFEEGIVVSRERHRGTERMTLPGGRVLQGEAVETTVLREVGEETGLQIELGPLLYACEVVAASRRQDLNLIFLARLLSRPEGEADVLRPEDEDPGMLPPVLDRIRRDQARGWEEMGVWLGNVWRGDLGR